MEVNGTQKATGGDFDRKKEKTFVQGFFISQALIWMINGFIYLSAGNDERVFSRFFLSIMCYGIFEILRAISHGNDKAKD